MAGELQQEQIPWYPTIHTEQCTGCGTYVELLPVWRSIRRTTERSWSAIRMAAWWDARNARKFVRPARLNFRSRKRS